MKMWLAINRQAREGLMFDNEHDAQMVAGGYLMSPYPTIAEGFVDCYPDGNTVVEIEVPDDAFATETPSCPGCGSTEPLSDIQARGFTSCCPDRPGAPSVVDWPGVTDHPIIGACEGDHCHAGQDGECNWPGCPQLRDGEPKATGRHCPLDTDDDA